jgi:hypothetical protein
MLSLKSISPAFCFCLLMIHCAVSTKADTTYTYTGAPYVEGAIQCPPECNFTGSFTLPMPIPPNANVAIKTFAFNSGPTAFTSLTNGPFGVSTNAAGAIDNWGIDMVAQIGNGEIAEIFSGPGGDQRVFGAPNPPNGIKFFGAADTFASGVWTVSTTGTNVPEPASGTLLIAGLVGLAGLALKKLL